MINKLITGISQKLDTEFNLKNDKYTIYTESIEQGFDEPCFSIISLKPISTNLVGNRYKREYSFDIQYFPENEQSNNEINEVMERLFTSLEYIRVDGNLVKGTNINGETVDNMLHFFINFNMIIKKETEIIDRMESLIVNQKTGGN
ncbi:phage tail terminator family protein [Clostridium butyricum]|uniref:phage tail terminator family protein n=1 Tax=Clostridium butyricum TaxID=1492 RepID=UPI0013D05E3B|nr:hypothetical protein [Clostridium butyricum]MCQ2017286.1 hypothetical protein [Clostridium butyricum]MCQ2021159.1 hypothetical protein [Clostridium butyricum]NFB72515.1 hypothetical protein [Clostridium butyricum]NFB91560.1 hypothetical protein [Clostridium butyricum]UTY53577.1 hypothetical protein HNS01_10910 [Clostridium butyricum]